MHPSIKDNKQLALAALMAAFTCIATMIIRIPTPTMGYIHPGDGLVLLCGVLLGPVIGGLSAGIGSMLSDVLSGYPVWAPATLIIKGLTAIVCGFLYQKLTARHTGKLAENLSLIAGGIVGELLMVFGYFVFEAGMDIFANGGFSAGAIASGITYAATGIFSNCIQGIAGIIIASVLLPILRKARVM